MIGADSGIVMNSTDGLIDTVETVAAAIDRMAAMRFKVLVADDSVADQLLAQRRINRSCCLELVATVSSGEKVQDYLSGTGIYSDRLMYPFPDLLMLDVDMPGGIDGLTLLDWIKKRDFPTLRVVMLSGSTDVGCAARALQLGADYFQSKNSHPHELNYFIRRIEFLMVLLRNREDKKTKANLPMPHTLTVVDGRGPPYEEALISAAETGRNFILVLPSPQDLEKLWSILGTTTVVPDRLQRWGLLALNEALTASDLDRLQRLAPTSYVYLIEQITLNRNVPPRTGKFLLYCELRGIISQHNTVEEAGLSLLDYLQGFKLARLLPLAGIYDHGSGKWKRVSKLSTN